MNHYEILGVPETASSEEIRKRFKMLALKYHPDKIRVREEVEEGTKIFQAINTAHEVLIDQQRRADYDMQLKCSREGSVPCGSQPSQGGAERWSRWDPYYDYCNARSAERYGEKGSRGTEEGSGRPRAHGSAHSYAHRAAPPNSTAEDPVIIEDSSSSSDSDSSPKGKKRKSVEETNPPSPNIQPNTTEEDASMVMKEVEQTNDHTHKKPKTADGSSDELHRQPEEPTSTTETPTRNTPTTSAKKPAVNIRKPRTRRTTADGSSEELPPQPEEPTSTTETPTGNTPTTSAKKPAVNIRKPRRRRTTRSSVEKQKTASPTRDRQPTQQAPNEEDKGPATGEDEKSTKKKIFQTRMSTDKLVRMVQKLNRAQKQAVTSLGFGSLLELNARTVSGPLADWLVKNFDHKEVCLKLDGERKIPITVEDVFLTTGFPMGPVEVKPEKEEYKSLYDDVLAEFRKDHGKRNPTLSEMREYVLNCKKGDAKFKRNFLIYALSQCVSGSKNNFTARHFLHNLKDLNEVPKMNWCRYLLDALCTSVRRVQEGETKSCDGWVFFLMMLYFDRVVDSIDEVHKPKRKFPTMNCWTNEQVNQRTAILEKSGFGGDYILDRIPFPDVHQAASASTTKDKGKGKVPQESDEPEDDRSDVAKLLSLHEKMILNFAEYDSFMAHMLENHKNDPVVLETYNKSLAMFQSFGQNTRQEN